MVMEPLKCRSYGALSPVTSKTSQPGSNQNRPLQGILIHIRFLDTNKGFPFSSFFWLSVTALFWEAIESRA
jgi:hypothetical protein